MYSKFEQNIINAVVKKSRFRGMNIYKLFLLISALVIVTGICPAIEIHFTRWLVMVGLLGFIVTLRLYEEDLFELIRKLKLDADAYSKKQ